MATPVSIAMALSATASFDIRSFMPVANQQAGAARLGSNQAWLLRSCTEHPTPNIFCPQVWSP
jgi:hypothetical protein